MTPTTAATPAPVSNSTLPSAPATAGATQAQPTDFLLMLGQLAAGGPEAPAVNAALVVGPALLETEGEDAELEEAPEDGLAMLSLPLSLPTTTTPAVAAKESAADMITELQLSRQRPMESIVPLLPQDTEALQELASTAEPVELGDAPAPFDNALALHSSEKLAHAPRAASAELSRPVHTPVGSSAWADDIGSRVTMMAKQGEQTASLRLSPEHLGPLEIRVAIRDDQASVWFGAAHADTRAAIENALPRLREMFEAQGMSLTDAGVFREPPHGQAPQASTTAPGAEDAQLESQPTTTRTALGLVDAYA
jgi:flagellar hook-length control protein FliK